MERDGAQPPVEHTPLWARTLEPLGRLYLRGSALLLERRRRNPVRLPLPVVSVGNLTFGGTGKTPVTLALARILQERGERPGVLLRGYGRRGKEVRVVRPGHGARAVGDEALLYALEGLPVAVGADRGAGARLLLREGVTVLLLDDGFQHVETARDLDLLLVDGSRPQDLLPPPAGRLREPLAGAARADAVLLTGGEDLPVALLSQVSGKPFLRVRFRWAEEPSLSVPPGLSWRALAGRPLAAFAGVGNPSRFLGDLEKAGLFPLRFLAFPDHAYPSPSRRRALRKAIAASQAEAVLTTEKDAVKWAPSWPFEVPLVWPRLEAVFEDPQRLLPRLLEGSLHRGRR